MLSQVMTSVCAASQLFEPWLLVDNRKGDLEDVMVVPILMHQLLEQTRPLLDTLLDTFGVSASRASVKRQHSSNGATNSYLCLSREHSRDESGTGGGDARCAAAYAVAAGLAAGAAAQAFVGNIECDIQCHPMVPVWTTPAASEWQEIELLSRRLLFALRWADCKDKETFLSLKDLLFTLLHRLIIGHLLNPRLNMRGMYDGGFTTVMQEWSAFHMSLHPLNALASAMLKRMTIDSDLCKMPAVDVQESNPWSSNKSLTFFNVGAIFTLVCKPAFCVTLYTEYTANAALVADYMCQYNFVDPDQDAISLRASFITP